MTLLPLVEPGPALTQAQLERYSRHILLPGVGVTGQRRLAAARVLVIGAGGLGSPVLTYLAAAGVGTIGIVDDDVVELSNLQRQVVHGQDDVGRSKVDSAADALAQINPLVRVLRHAERLGTDNALELIGDYDLVLDGADNFPTRYLVSDACAVLGVPCVWGSVYRFDGQLSVFWSAPGGSAQPVTYRDVHPQPPPPGAVPSCAEGGVLGVVCAAIGSAMANEAVKLVCGIGEPLLGRVMLFDALGASWRTIGVRAAAGRPPVSALEEDYQAFCGVRAPVPADVSAGTIGVRQLAGWLDERSHAERDFVLVDVREPFEREIVVIPGAVSIPLAQLTADPVAVLKEFLPAGDRGTTAADPAIILHCKSGGRSAQALEALLAAGVPGAVHVLGGVLAWIDEIDPSQPRY